MPRVAETYFLCRCVPHLQLQMQAYFEILLFESSSIDRTMINWEQSNTLRSSQLEMDPCQKGMMSLLVMITKASQISATLIPREP